MLGMRREGVTEAAGHLQHSRSIHYECGRSGSSTGPVWQKLPWGSRLRKRLPTARPIPEVWPQREGRFTETGSGIGARHCASL